MNNRLKTHEAAKLLGIEPARFRFLEMHCQDFLSLSRLEIPRTYSTSDLKILAAANRLLKDGLAPTALRTHLSKMLADPSGWTGGSNGVGRNGLNAGKLIAITSGKGGVGKSNVALNLSVELAREGLRTAVMDADLGVANLHLLAGLTTDRTLTHVISGECAIDEIIARMPGGPDIVPGSSGIFEMANLPAHRRQTLLAGLRKLESRYDVILIDTAAGVGGSVLDFLVSSDFVLVVTTPETTAIADAYALIKLTFQRSPYCRIGVVANRVRSAREGAATLGRISDCTRRFLARSLLELGHIWEDSHVRRAVDERVPFSVGYPQSRASAAVRRLARTLLEKGTASPRPRMEGTGFGVFVERCSVLAAATAE